MAPIDLEMAQPEGTETPLVVAVNEALSSPFRVDDPSKLDALADQYFERVSKAVDQSIEYLENELSKELVGEEPNNEASELKASDEKTTGDESHLDSLNLAANKANLEIIFVDQNVPEYLALVEDIIAETDSERNFRVVILPGDSYGIDRMTQVLGEYKEVSAVHLVSHGENGAIQIGNDSISVDSLDLFNEQFSQWGQALKDDADLLIYGCNIAENQAGRELVDALARLCDCDVAASDDLTGHENLGGDWDLEYRAGRIQTDLAFSEELMSEWAHIMDVEVGNSKVFITPSHATTDSTSFNASAGGGSDRILVVGVSFGEDQGDQVDSITFHGTNLTKVGEHQDADKSRVEIWALIDPANGNRTLEINYTGNSHQGAVVGIMTFTDVDQANPFGTFTFAEGDSSSQSVTTPTAPSELIFGVLAYSDSNDYEFTADTGVERWEDFSDKANGVGSTLAVHGGSEGTVSWSTSSNNTWTAAAVSIKSATASIDPTITGLDGQTLNYFEDQAARTIDQNNNIVVDDVDSSDFDNGILRVSITSGGQSSEDILGIRNQGTSDEQIGVSGSNITFNYGSGPVNIGSFTGGSGGDDLVITFNSNANWQAASILLENITYHNTDNENPTESNRNVQFQLFDGDGGVSAAQNVTVTVTRVNDAPTSSNRTVTTDEDLIYTFSASDFGFSDVDSGDSLQQIRIKSLEAMGELRLGGVAVSDEQVILVGDIPNLTFEPAADESGNNYDSFTFRVHDGTEYSSAIYTMTIDVDPINDAPEIVDLDGDTLNYLEDDPALLIEQGNDALVSDVDSTNFDGGDLTISITNGGVSSEDVLAIRDQGVGSGNISLLGSNVRFDFGGSVQTIGTFTGGTNGDNLVISLNGNSDSTSVSALIKNITYLNSNTVDPGETTRTVEFALSDGDGDTSPDYQTTVTVTAGGNESPVFTSPTAQNVDENSILVHTLTATDADLPAQTITFSIKGDGPDDEIFSINGSNQLVFNAPPDFENPNDVGGNNIYNVNVIADDGQGGQTTQSITVSVNDLNESPQALDDSFTLDNQDSLVITQNQILANDSDPENGPLTILVVNPPDHGTLILNPDNSFTYRPDVGFVGQDFFVYEISDGFNAPVSANVVLSTGAIPPPADPVDPIDEPITETEPDSDSETEPEVETNDPIKEEDDPKTVLPAGISTPVIVSPFSPKIPGPDSELPGAFPDSVEKEIMEIAFSETSSNTSRTTTASETTFDITQFKPESPIPVEQLFEPQFVSDQFVGILDNLHGETEKDDMYYQAVVSSTVAITGSLTVGYVVWMIRGGVLLSSIISSLPAWKLIDPLPILGDGSLGPDENDESLEEMVEKSNATQNLTTI